MIRTLQQVVARFRADSPSRPATVEDVRRYLHPPLRPGSVHTQLETTSFPGIVLDIPPPAPVGVPAQYPWEATFSSLTNVPLLAPESVAFPFMCFNDINDRAGWAWNLSVFHYTVGGDLVSYPAVLPGTPVIINVGRPVPLGPVGASFGDCIGGPETDPELNPQFFIWFSHWSDPFSMSCIPQPGAGIG